MSSFLTIAPKHLSERENQSHPLADATVLFGIGASPMALRVVEVIRALEVEGIKVDALMGSGTERFLGPDSLSPLNAAALDSLNLLVVAPCERELLNRLVERPCGDRLAEIAHRTSAPKTIVVPHLTRQEWKDSLGLIERIRAESIAVLGPSDELLPGKVADTAGLFEPRLLSSLIRATLGREVGDLRGRHLVISAGGNKESIDAVRWISNRSSGKQGHAIAEAARDRGAIVTLITCAPESAPLGLENVVAVESHAQLQRAVEAATQDASAYIAAAAVADFTPSAVVDGKLHRKDGEEIAIRLRPTTDILAGLPSRPGFVKVAFAAEAEGSAEANQAKALQKLERKGASMIVLNDVLAADAGFGKDTNRISIIDRSGVKTYPAAGRPALAKYDVANIVLDHLVSLLPR